MKYILEVCCDNIESVKEAKKGGAERVELCSALSEGGLTPSVGTVIEAVKTGIKVNVLIRPRGGDFLYTPAEVDTMASDIEALRGLGINGVVIGALTAKGDVDMPACRRMVEVADNTEVTFHRAFDRCRDPFKALEDVVGLGCKRILTSGLQPTAIEGVAMLAQLVKQAAGRISIMPGSGVKVDNALKILQATGAVEIHSSASSKAESKMEFLRNNPGGYKLSDSNIVKAIIASING